MSLELDKSFPSRLLAIAEPVTEHSGLMLHWDGFRPAQSGQSLGRDVQLAVKRLLDIGLSLIALLLLCPLLLLVAASIKLGDRGPVLFRQDRGGLHGRNFRIVKFRTMRVSDTLPDEDRTTVLGRFLRRTSLDELPQLFNVIVGDMALVGPRPHIHDMPVFDTTYERLIPYYAQRFAMRPGITGWAQANGLRGPLEEPQVARARIDHDLAYIENFSLPLDLKILWITLWREFLTGTGR